MNRVRVLIVDDSAVIRRMLTDILSAEPDLEVVGSAPNAAIARSRFETSRPDVVTLDVELPDASGLDLLSEFRRQSPKLPIVMFSSLTQRAAATTLDALARGASDYVTKPTQVGSREEAVAHVRNHLVAKIRALTAVRRASLAPAALTAAPPRAAFGTRIDLLAIGTSTGGPNALAELFTGLPANLSCPVAIVQHMPPLFTRLLAERLTAGSPLTVHEAVHGQHLEPGHAYVAPGDYHMKVARERGRLVALLDQGPQENSCRPAVDVLFRSVAATFGPNALAAVLTGMGSDGMIGSQAIRAAGGQVIVQDEASSIVWGMPGAVARAGAADAIVPLHRVADELLQRILSGQGGRAEPKREVRDVR